MIYYPHMATVTEEQKQKRKKLGDKLRIARENLGLTQVQVALEAKIDDNFYARVERGEEAILFERLQRVLKVLKIKSLEV